METLKAMGLAKKKASYSYKVFRKAAIFFLCGVLYYAFGRLAGGRALVGLGLGVSFFAAHVRMVNIIFL